MGRMLPFLALLVGIGAGIGAGLLFKDSSEVCPDGIGTGESTLSAGCEDLVSSLEPAESEGASEYVRMSNQFVIPVLEGDEVRSLVVMSLSLEVAAGATSAVFGLEPKLRDGFLRVLFDHANAGGFVGSYTGAGPMNRLRQALLESARANAGSDVRDILILDLLRQEM